MRIRVCVFCGMRTVFWFLFLGLLPAGLLAQPEVAQVVPRQNEIHTPVTSRVTVTFSQDMDAASLNNQTWVVSGSLTGIYSGVITYEAATRTAHFTPTSFFKEGEIISSTLTAGVLSRSGQPLSKPFQWSFTVSVEYGSGIFEERIEITNPQNERDAIAIYSGDFNNDRYADLALANMATNTVTIYLNRFAVFGGSFEFQNSVAVGNGPNSIAGGDFNNDGLLDLAVSNFDGNSISLLQNNGAGNFSVSQTIPTAEHPVQITTRDFNNDGKVDLAVLAFGVNRLQIILNLGNDIFSPTSENYATGASPFGLTTGDFDNDGDVDIVVSNSGDNSITMFDNLGQARFSNAGEFAVDDSPTMIQSNDLLGRTTPNKFGDGRLDLVVIHPNLNTVSILDNRTRDGGFVVSQKLQVGVRPSAVVIADIDTTDQSALTAGLGKDHDLDLAVTNLFAQNLTILRNDFNNGLAYQSGDTYASGATPIALTSADFDGDGDLDFAISNFATNTLSILLNRGGRSGNIRISLPPRVLDFGQVYVGTDSVRRLSVINPTGETITVENISTTLPVFTVADSQVEIAPGQTFNLAITFSPMDTVVYEDTLTFRTQGLSSFENLTLGLRGEGIRAIISVTPDTLNFGNVLPPQSRTRPIQISNGGNGAIKISDMRFTHADFSTPDPNLTVPAYSSQMVDITFQPTAVRAYLDTLTIFSNDSSQSQFPVILLGGPNQFPPQITSTDTMTAVEDVFAQYTATANDSDGTGAQFTFLNLPSWLQVSSPAPENNSIEGTPREGDLDTTFVVIARDGIFSDTLSVYVRVIPVNDAPVFNAISAQTAQELSPLTFNLSAADPEDSTLTYSALNLPQGADLRNNLDNTATFSWTPPFGSRGDYTVTFVVTELWESNPLSDTTQVKISVIETLPDLTVASLGINDTDITLNQTRLITGVARTEIVPVQQAFRITFLHDGNVVRDTVVTGLDSGEEVTFQYAATFARLGSHEIVFYVDMSNLVTEADEENNSAVLRLKTALGSVVVRPNPFTPNADGFNDMAEFNFAKLFVQQPQLKIYKFNGDLLTTLNQPVGTIFRWDGRDDRGRDQKPGIYLYVLTDDEQKVASGYLVLAR